MLRLLCVRVYREETCRVGVFFFLFHTVNTDADCFQYWNCVNSGGLHLCSTVVWKIPIWINFLLLLKELDFLLYRPCCLLHCGGSLALWFDFMIQPPPTVCYELKAGKRKKESRKKEGRKKDCLADLLLPIKTRMQEQQSALSFPSSNPFVYKEIVCEIGASTVRFVWDKNAATSPGDSRTDHILSIKM